MTLAIENIYNDGLSGSVANTELLHEVGPEIGIDIAGWSGQTALQLATLAQELPQASGFIMHPGEAALTDVGRDIHDSGRAVILDDMDLLPKDDILPIWRDPKALALQGIRYVVKPLQFNGNTLLPPAGLGRHGIKTITQLAPHELVEYSIAQPDVTDLSRLMLATSIAMNRDGLPRIILPEDANLWSRRLRTALIEQNDGLLYFANTPSRTAETALRKNRHQVVRAIVSPPGGAENASNPVEATIREAKRVMKALTAIQLPEPSVAEVPKPMPQAKKEAALFTPEQKYWLTHPVR